MLENKNNEVVEMDQSINNVDPFRTMNMSTYVREIMPDEMKDFQAAGRIKSGFANLDAKTNLYPGLYFLGGQSSLGKTTLAHQMSDQIAQSGEHVLYFSLEQSALELSTKSLGRNMYLLDPDKALTSLQIRKTEASDPRLGPTLQKYLQYAGNITVVECSFKATIDDIEKYVNNPFRSHNIPPLLCNRIHSIHNGHVEKSDIGIRQFYVLIRINIEQIHNILLYSEIKFKMRKINLFLLHSTTEFRDQEIAQFGVIHILV